MGLLDDINAAAKPRARESLADALKRLAGCKTCAEKRALREAMKAKAQQAAEPATASAPPAEVAYDLDYYERMLRINSGSNAAIAAIRWKFVERCKAKAVLDFGSGLGAFRAYRPPGVEVDTTDVNPSCPTTGSRRDRYDLVTLWDVLEHLSDESAVEKFLRTAYWAAVTIPIRPPNVPTAAWHHTKPGEHVRELTEVSLTALFGKLGYDLATHGMPECPPRQDVHSFLFRRRRKIILRNGQCPGDGVAMSRCLEDLKATHPTWSVDVRTTCNQLYLNNPRITKLDARDPAVEVLAPNYDGINKSNQRSLSYCEAWSESLGKLLGEDLVKTGVGPKLYLSAAEQVRPADWPKRYWVLCAGWKDSCPNKRYHRWQEVADLLRKEVPGVEIVQIGHSARSHHHEPIRGAVNFIGQGDRDQRIMLRQIFHADGVLCQLSGPSLIAQALDKPVIIVGGGREPHQWQAMSPRARFLTTVGQMSCCTPYSCWKSMPAQCRNYNAALGAPECMLLIAPEEIVREVKKFYAGGRLNGR